MAPTWGRGRVPRAIGPEWCGFRRCPPAAARKIRRPGRGTVRKQPRFRRLRDRRMLARGPHRGGLYSGPGTPCAPHRPPIVPSPRGCLSRDSLSHLCLCSRETRAAENPTSGSLRAGAGRRCDPPAEVRPGHAPKCAAPRPDEPRFLARAPVLDAPASPRPATNPGASRPPVRLGSSGSRVRAWGGAARGRMGAGEGPTRGPQDEDPGDAAPVPRYSLRSAPRAAPGGFHAQELHARPESSVTGHATSPRPHRQPRGV